MTEVWREGYPGRSPFSVSWAIRAPWAHPVWNEYLAVLCDLTSPVACQDPVIHLPGATHEFLLFAVGNISPLDRDVPLIKQQIELLDPPNFAYQFKAASDELAESRIQAVMEMIVRCELSPDTDWRPFWHSQLFPDAFSLIHKRRAK